MRCHGFAALFSLLVALFPITTPAHALEKATIQLKWLHHFQFAGYYMALEKGFYRDAGLDIVIREGGPAVEVEREVASGRADFGTGTSSLLLYLARGEDLVVLGQIFQHSPAIFLTPRKTGIRSIKEMAGRRFMYANQHGDMGALLKRHGVEESRIVKVPHNGDPANLLKGKADVMLAYSFNEPFFLEAVGEPYLTFSPLSFGIDFYGDNLFTTKRMVRERPEFTKAFRDASLLGWRYALEHKAEAVELIHSKYTAGMSREWLHFEADQVDNLVQPDLVEIGYQSLERWQRIADTFAELGMLPKGFDPSPVIYAPRQIRDYGPLLGVIVFAAAAIGVLAWMVTTFRRLNIKLENEIVERRGAEKALREREELFSLFMKHSPLYTYIKRVEENQSRVVAASDNFIDLTGLKAEEMVGRTMEELFPPEFARKITEDDLSVVREGRPIQLDEEFGGRSFTTIKFPIAMNGRSSLLAGFTMDVTERVRAERALRESEERHRVILRTAMEGFWLVNMEGRLLEVNDAYCRMSGYVREELLTMGISDLEAAETAEEISSHMKLLTEIGSDSFETRHRRRDGSLFDLEINAQHSTLEGGSFVVFMRDITGRKRAEEKRRMLESQLFHAQKLESLGVLAGGIAHDFNNILMAVMGNAELALMRLGKESPVAENLQRIEQAAARAADLARQMLAYSGKGRFVVERIDLNHLLEEMLPMLQASISKKVVLHLNPTSRIPSVQADATQLRQIVLNLVINSSEAIGERSGIIAISTGCMRCDSSCIKGLLFAYEISEGFYTYLEVTDTGCGMDEETLARVFDPFFSTKFTGRGLGMAAVLGIIRGHKGGIRVESTPGKGSSFRILLPASDALPELVEEGAGIDERRFSGTVLLVDDEETVRAVGSEMLMSLGLGVVTAADGREALDLLRVRDDIDLVILDLTMPIMDGEECCRELRLIRPDMMVIVSSGYSEEDVAKRFKGEPVAGFIQKPYDLPTLKKVLTGIV